MCLQSFEKQFHPDGILLSSALRQLPQLPGPLVRLVRDEGEGHVRVDVLLDTLLGTLGLQVGLPLLVWVDCGSPQYRHHHLHGGSVTQRQGVDQVRGAEH